MDYEKKIEIPFGAFDSDLIRQEISIPNGFEAVIDGNKIILTRAESEDEKIRKDIIKFVQMEVEDEIIGNKWIAWLKKQGEQKTDEWKEGNIIRHGGILALVIKGRRTMKSNGEIFTVQYPDEWVKASPDEIEHFLGELKKRCEQKPTQEIEPFEAEHGKYYYCIKDYFCGGRKQASKGDVIQALRGLPIMGLKDASEYFLPVNFIKCNSAWSEEDEKTLTEIFSVAARASLRKSTLFGKNYDYIKWQNWLKSLKPQLQWKPSDEQIKAIRLARSFVVDDFSDHPTLSEILTELEEQLQKIKENEQ